MCPLFSLHNMATLIDDFRQANIFANCFLSVVWGYTRELLNELFLVISIKFIKQLDMVCFFLFIFSEQQEMGITKIINVKSWRPSSGHPN